MNVMRLEVLNRFEKPLEGAPEAGDIEVDEDTDSAGLAQLVFLGGGDTPERHGLVEDGEEQRAII